MKRITLQELDLMIAEREWPGRFAIDEFGIDDNQEHLSMSIDNAECGFLDANAMLPIQMRDGLWPEYRYSDLSNCYIYYCDRYIKYGIAYTEQGRIPPHKNPLTAVKLAYLKLHWPVDEFELVEEK